MSQVVGIGSGKRVAQTFECFYRCSHSYERRMTSLSACIGFAPFYESWSAEEGRDDRNSPT
jgi:hypothetical protein